MEFCVLSENIALVKKIRIVVECVAKVATALTLAFMFALRTDAILLAALITLYIRRLLRIIETKRLIAKLTTTTCFDDHTVIPWNTRKR